MGSEEWLMVTGTPWFVYGFASESAATKCRRDPGVMLHPLWYLEIRSAN